MFDDQLAIPAICRLCTSSELLSSVFKVDVDMLLVSDKINNCTQLKIFPDDGLPSLICKTCEEIICNFYKFKLRCLDVDTKIRNIVNNSQLISIETDKKKDFEAVINCKLNQEFNLIDVWLVDDIKTEEAGIELQDNCKKNMPSIDFNTGFDATITNRVCTSTKPYTRTFLCETCGKVIKKRGAFERHILCHSGIKLFSCKICSRQFTRAEHKIIHMRSHLGIKPYICDMCGRSSTKRQDLIRHMKIHSDEKKYACPTCGKRFKRPNDVNNHLRTHTGARPFSCKVCMKDYTSHSGLRKHYNAHCKKVAGN